MLNALASETAIESQRFILLLNTVWSYTSFIFLPILPNNPGFFLTFVSFKERNRIFVFLCTITSYSYLESRVPLQLYNEKALVVKMQRSPF